MTRLLRRRRPLVLRHLPGNLVGWYVQQRWLGGKDG